ncbi:DNA helicase [Sphaerisporangium krabiense]|uniref:ATP-dependent DNA helicase n=1 Tax=Sphaerisporangium krabiense TaxID=763782 RepID=A0A7W8Z017_9ACTN|nr:DNA helicase-2/ATP-dependent DNA helicase PcrA [Sphaerisporangium krabiense]GII66457.1 DNA helicase [Sphaerisporangium krabiense]
MSTRAANPAVDHPLLDGLNPQQRDAVVHEGSPLLIVAGAGSGKTRVLTHRIAYLLSERHVQPQEVLAITFTNKAAKEMKERVDRLIGPRSRAMWVMTFHSACVRILRREAKRLGFSSSFSIYDQADSQRLMAMVCRELELDPKRYPPRSFSAQVSNLKNELIDYDTAKDKAQTHLERTLAQAYATYQRRLTEADAMDFDDLIMLTVTLFQLFPDVAEHYRRRFRHVMVDEYQDTNHAQYMLIRELVGLPERLTVDGEPVAEGGGVEPAELCVVGDADQSIYAFRGATIRNILEFERDYPQARTILLEQNYRSTQTILSAANAVISRNESRKPKNLWSDQGAGPKIIGYVADNEHDEAMFVAQEVDRLADDEDVTPGQVAVFYRTNAASRVFEEIFIRTGLPYKVVGGVRFYERREVRDLLAYLRVLANPNDTVSLRRVINVPKRGIGERAEAMVEAFATRERVSFWEGLRRAEEAPGLATRSLNAIKEFVALLEDLRGKELKLSELAEEVLASTGYRTELETSGDPQDESRLENLNELISVAQEFEEANPEGTLVDFLEQVSLVADADQIPEGEDHQGVVTLMTLHTAKGLEFPVVFLTGLEDGVFPHMRSLGEPRELEEERRLAYVGITRAQQRLYVSRAAVRSSWGSPAFNPASRFLAEVPSDLLDWRSDPQKSAWTAATVRETRAPAATSSRGGGRSIPNLSPGDRVTHDAFGLGTVVTVEGVAEKAKVKIDFGSGGEKTLLLAYAPIEKL